MSITGYSHDQLVAAAGHVDVCGRAVEGLRKGVNTTVQELVASGRASGWEGPAAQKYMHHMNDWDLHCKKILTSLERIYDNLMISAKEYSKASDGGMHIAGVQANTNAVDSLINVRA